MKAVLSHKDKAKQRDNKRDRIEEEDEERKEVTIPHTELGNAENMLELIAMLSFAVEPVPTCLKTSLFVCFDVDGVIIRSIEISKDELFRWEGDTQGVQGWCRVVADLMRSEGKKCQFFK